MACGNLQCINNAKHTYIRTYFCHDLLGILWSMFCLWVVFAEVQDNYSTILYCSSLSSLITSIWIHVLIDIFFFSHVLAVELF